MTLVVAMSGPGWAFITSDRRAFMTLTADDEAAGRWTASEFDEPGKVAAITPSVLLALTGCHATGTDFRDRLSARVTDGGLVACHAAARAVIAELWEENRGLVYYERHGKTWKQTPFRDPDRFGFVLAGLLDVGGSGLVSYRSGAPDVAELTLELPTFCPSVPYGVDETDVLQFAGGDEEYLRELLTFHGALRHAFSIHHHIWTTYDDRTSAEVDVTALSAGDHGAPAAITFMLDCRDTAAFWELYNGLVPNSRAQHAGDSRSGSPIPKWGFGAATPGVL